MKPLEGITVLEFSTMITASFAAMMLGEQGARVIKVEPIEMGDPMRYIGTAKGGMSALFANCNRGKESIRVNLKDPAGQALVRELVAEADVVIHNFRPGVMDKLNLGSEQLRGLNDRLVYMAISGFGQTGPLSGAPAYDPVIQAQTGMTASQGAGGHTFIRNLMCDKITAYTACQAVTSALFMRERFGSGQHIDLSMLDSGLFFIFPDSYMNHTLIDEDVEVQALLSDMIYQLTETSDGGITMSAASDNQRLGVLKAVGKEEMASDPRFSTLEALLQNFEAYRDLLADAFLALTTDDALAKLQENDVPCAKCLSLEEVLDHEQLRANDSIVEREHPLMGSMRIMKAPPRFGGESLTPGEHSPAHGEHTDKVLASYGIDESRLQSLKASGVVA
jgi:crotonobetainyl-CoA:carnitine CoA-transferase CaiB-like acyl-CoA transferase